MPVIIDADGSGLVVGATARAYASDTRIIGGTSRGRLVADEGAAMSLRISVAACGGIPVRVESVMVASEIEIGHR